MDINVEQGISARIGKQLHTNRLVKVGEILLVFISAFILIRLMNPVVGDDLILKQAVVWIANILMLIIVWTGLKLRGESWNNFGLTFKSISWREGTKMFLLSLFVFVLAVAGFFIGSIIMASITGIPDSADMSGYDFLKDNIGMLLVTLGGVYIVSSFGEEVIYRAFLINRISELGLDTKKGRIIVIILSSIIFGLVHYEWGSMGIVQTGFMGLALGICYIKFKKRLWILILAHAYMDTILLVQMYIASN
ncbi:CPBP family intramembrane glutamic endopeptidase [uncultured Draconibacterium sp.]|uniref:CPBP family intramembrane glutamic endopeptidase n=1 Tax=uncultured Draconibacterium sp. TaxID=1573823 RepID=UPI0029C61AB2|nr:CPBP family intramembrane glutamic endopeptidase [uncultured Draconibacterium sp.]